MHVTLHQSSRVLGDGMSSDMVSARTWHLMIYSDRCSSDSEEETGNQHLPHMRILFLCKKKKNTKICKACVSQQEGRDCC